MGADIAAGLKASVDHRRERERLGPGERCGFDFSEDPNLDPHWVMSHCTESEVVGEEEACVGCPGFGMDCWSVWVWCPLHA